VAATLNTRGLRLAPVTDGHTLPADPFDPTAPEMSADIPVLIGSTEFEVTFFPFTKLDPISDDELHAAVKQSTRSGDADADKLMDGGIAADDRVVGDRDMAAERPVVGHDDIAADRAVMRHMGPCHEEAVIADARHHAATLGPRVHGDAFTDGVALADLQGAPDQHESGQQLGLDDRDAPRRKFHALRAQHRSLHREHRSEGDAEVEGKDCEIPELVRFFHAARTRSAEFVLHLHGLDHHQGLARPHLLPGGHGHLHAIRAELYPFPPPGTINDDYIIHASVIAKGKRAVYEPAAVIREEAHEMTGFGRRIRIMAGNIQQLREIRPLLWPIRPLPLFFFFSHKALRLMVPFAMIAALIANAFLLRERLYEIIFAAQLTFYALAIIGSAVRLRPKILMLPYYFSMINAAMFLGAYHALTGLKTMRWK